MKHDPVSERAVLGAIFQHGATALYEVDDILRVESFESNHQLIYACLKKVLESSDVVDLPSFLSAAKELGLSDYFSDTNLAYIKSLIEVPVKLSNVRNFAVKVRKLDIAKQIQSAIRQSYEQISNVTSESTIDEILSIAEYPSHYVYSNIVSSSNIPQKLFSSIEEHIKYVKDNQTERIGIPTGFNIYDEVIGGGQRRGSVNLIVARPKSGKMQPLDAIVHTPDGPKFMGQLEVGDEVCTPDGVSKIDGVFYHGLQDVYKVIFHDGSSTECGMDHLWYVSNVDDDDYKVLPLYEILKVGITKDGKFLWKIPFNNPVHYNGWPIKDRVKYLMSISGDDCGCSIRELAWSLGYQAENQYGKWVVEVDHPGVRIIVDVKYAGKKECRCIHLEDERGLYITDDYIVTHNTTLAKQVGIHVAKLNIPVLMLDTEMNIEDQLNRSIASEADVDILDVEKGKFEEDDILQRVEQLKELPFYYQSVAGRQFEEILSIIKRWLVVEVGINELGITNDCLVIYDYFKLMNTKDLEKMQEYQALGFQLSRLTDFCNQNKIPVLGFVQANREGIVREESDIVSQSDRLLWFCSSLTLLKRKTQEEIIADGEENGNAKLVPLECRYGPGLQRGDYINILFDLRKSRMSELKTKSQILAERSGFRINDR